MMWGYGYGTWWMWLPGLLVGLILLAGVAVVIVLTVRATGAGRRPSDSAGEMNADPARRVLEDRLARGEITAAEFRDLLDTLTSSRHPR